jgi:predicted transcriptional regulator of viral defense system
MKHDEFVSFLKERNIQVFTIREASKILGKSTHYATKFMKTGKGIERIERGKYCIKNTADDIVASHVVYPSYLSLISAFRFYNLTTQLPMEKYVITTVQHKRMNFHNYNIRFIKVNKKLLFGFETVNNVIVATPEKAFVDAMYLKKSIWYTEEFENGIKKGVIDMKVLKKYAMAFKDPNLISRLGHFLERYYSVNCDDILRYRSKRYVNMTKDGRKKDSRWRVFYDD